jgi:hypothetical protein
MGITFYNRSTCGEHHDTGRANSHCGARSFYGSHALPRFRTAKTQSGTTQKCAWPSRSLRVGQVIGIIRSMTNMMKGAIAVLHELPEERQETIARAIID